MKGETRMEKSIRDSQPDPRKELLRWLIGGIAKWMFIVSAVFVGVWLAMAVF